MYIACGLLEYCRGLQGEEQGHQVTDWPGGGGERERERERERGKQMYTQPYCTQRKGHNTQRAIGNQLTHTVTTQGQLLYYHQ